MEITINATPKEIAALVVGLQERQSADDLAEAIVDRISRRTEEDRTYLK